ncbi:hypothetical protein HBI38_228650 [Parastagonospora nodorum]|nr:hypothetical protein HBH46_228230 [Parastagonospora nodorum]KAH5005424.1 hypothetical protein HBI75_227520 [Parastagonospora nodorum]KAH5118867.1 hypothetical protein HBH71_084470 [Parastagonospora nodorum]KAH5383331.1 hypothetical protein HBI33_121730 [Parastagonospora nodorum]KAH5420895.1 hypothetical protein HBI46_080520 [Parastagonospora nodorum]
MVIILISITLAGCSSYSTMTNIYILGMSYANSTHQSMGPNRQSQFNALQSLRGTAQLEVRVGYFGMCVRQQSILWLCTSDASLLTQEIGAMNDPLDLIGAASSFKDDVLFSGVMLMVIVLAFLTLLTLATFPGWHKERDPRSGSDVDVKPFPTLLAGNFAMAGSFVAAMLLLVAGLWQHVGAVGAGAMAKTANVGNVTTEIGVSAMIVTWVAVFFEFAAAAGGFLLAMSILILDRFT